ncbi:hypothetical protein PR048_013147 [Dryococelus australis]|uniref:Uncharacterized protein n=1 Tax=Dryococelus australis TaxID=614101 RepID=A0ABQ9HRB8_9NEOP|nr:hypothetical protein PR048_013147 [Dryococelus australis]
MHKSKLTQDREDGAKVLAFLQQNSPFTTDPTLRNIVTGCTFDTDSVNVQNILFIGENILKNLVGKDVFTSSCKRKDFVQTLTLSTKVKVNSDDDTSFDQGVLFQRSIVAANNGGAIVEEVLDYELCPYPPSLFETSIILHKTHKSPLANIIHEFVLKSSPKEELHEHAATESERDNNYYVLDGGSLLYRLPWQQGVTYDKIASSYADFTCKKYGRVSVVYDGYSASMPSIKDSKYHRHGVNTKQAPTVNLIPETVFIGKKDKFLLNTGNKTKMIGLIGHHLQKKGCKVMFAEGDADISIVRESFEIPTLRYSETSAFKKLLNSGGLKEVAQIFCEPKKSPIEIEDVGRKAMLILFEGRKYETLKELRYRTFKEKVASSKTFVKSELLPPTELARMPICGDGVCTTISTFRTQQTFHQHQDLYMPLYVVNVQKDVKTYVVAVKKLACHVLMLVGFVKNKDAKTLYNK